MYPDIIDRLMSKLYVYFNDSWLIRVLVLMEER